MRTYLELFELLPEGSVEEADFIRIDVTDWSQSDIDNAIKFLEEHAEKSYPHYTLQIHYCYHDEGKSCQIMIIKQA